MGSDSSALAQTFPTMHTLRYYIRWNCSTITI